MIMIVSVGRVAKAIIHSLNFFKSRITTSRVVRAENRNAISCVANGTLIRIGCRFYIEQSGNYGESECVTLLYQFHYQSTPDSSALIDNETILTDNRCATSKSPGIVIWDTIRIHLKSFAATEGSQLNTASHFIFVTGQIMIRMTSIPIILA